MEEPRSLVTMSLARIKVRKQAKKHIYVHNDLSNAAYHFNKKVNKRLANNDMEGIAFDILAELIFLAFSIEAKTNFLGTKLIGGWNERRPFLTKFKQVV